MPCRLCPRPARWVPPADGFRDEVSGCREQGVLAPRWEDRHNIGYPLGVTWEGAAGAKDQERLLVSFTGGTVADSLHARPLAGREKFVEEQFEQALPGFSANHIKSEFVDWIGDQWTKCGYSFPLPGEFLSQSKILKDGLGNLHFAGEHASLGFFGFMEGGLHSGAQAAHRLMHRVGV